jgi:hypothetical protein
MVAMTLTAILFILSAFVGTVRSGYRAEREIEIA